MDSQAPKARCVHCRADISVPDSYAHGDHIKCGECGTQHRVQRGEVLRLVLADVAPLQEAVRENELRISNLESDLKRAVNSFGVGVNGLFFGAAYLAWQILLRGELFSTPLAITALSIAAASGALLELANWLFFSKRRAITRITGEIEQIRSEARLLQQRIREASRK
jgi:hypothetical protein